MEHELIARFLDSPYELSVDELDRLILSLRTDSALARDVRSLLMTDDLIGRALAADRADFAGQVRQRLQDIHGRVAKQFEKNVLRLVAQDKREDNVWGRRWAVGLLAAAAALLVAVGVWWQGQAPVVEGNQGMVAVVEAKLTVESLNGDVVVVRDGRSRKSAVGMDIKGGELIRTGSKAWAVLAYAGESSRVKVLGDTDLARPVGSTTTAAGKRLRLENGRIDATIAHQATGLRMAVETPLALATVVGTKFSMLSQQGRDRIDVDEGMVELMTLASGRKVVVEKDLYGVVREGSADPSVYGRILLSDNFDQGLTQWDVFREVDGVMKPADQKILSRVMTVNRTDGKGGKSLMVDARNLGPNEWIIMIFKQATRVDAALARVDYKVEEVNKQGQFDLTVHIRERYESVGKKFYPVQHRIGTWTRAETEWEQIVAASGDCQVSRRMLWDGKIGFEEKRLVHGAKPVDVYMQIGFRGCLARVDDAVVLTTEPMSLRQE
jgi:hypothetical protein